MSNKIYDLCVKTGEYQTRDGQVKAQWLNIGAVMQDADNKSFILLDRTFNPAGVPVEGNTGRVLVSLFKPKDKARD